MADITTINPDAETASPEGRLVDPGDALGATAATRRLPFAARMQAILVVVMVVAFILIGQQFDKRIYQIGLPLLVLASFTQIAFGNIPPTAGVRKSLGLLALTWVIVIAFFVVAVNIAPQLIALGR